MALSPSAEYAMLLAFCWFAAPHLKLAMNLSYEVDAPAAMVKLTLAIHPTQPAAVSTMGHMFEQHQQGPVAGHVPAQVTPQLPAVAFPEYLVCRTQAHHMQPG